MITGTIHPRTGLAALGYRKDGRPIWPVMGGSQPAGEPVTAPPAGTEPTTAPVAPPAAPPAQPQQPQAQPPAFDPSTLSPEARAWIEAERKRIAAEEGAKARTTSKANARTETLSEIAKALGLEPAADPAKLAEQLTAENRNLKINAAIGAAARTAGADETLVAALLSHQGRTADLDPAAPDFGDKVNALVAAEVAANPRLKLAPPAAAPVTQGAVGGFNGQQNAPRVADLNAAVGEYYNRNAR